MPQPKTLTEAKEQVAEANKQNLAASKITDGKFKEGTVESFFPELKFDVSGNVVEEKPAVVSTSAMRKDIADRGEDATKTDFETQDDFETFKERVEPVDGAPTRDKTRVSQFEELRAEHGIEDIEENIASNIEEQETMLANLEEFRIKEAEGQPLGFATGRIQEEQRNVQARLDALQRIERTLTSRLNTRNKAIETTMQLTDKDFDEARDEYEFEYNKNLAIFNAFEQKEKEADAFTKATYNSIYNMMTNSGKSWDELPDKMKTEISTMEVKMGIPVGTFESLAISKPKANIIQQGKSIDESGNEFAWSVIQNEDGTPEVIKTFTGGFKETEGEEDLDKRKEFDDAIAFVEANKDKSFNELKLSLQRDSDLSDSDITSILTTAGKIKDEVFLSPENQQKIATALLKKVATVGRDLAEEKDLAIQQIKSGSIKSGGKTIKLSKEQQDDIIILINKGRTKLQKVLPGGK